MHCVHSTASLAVGFLFISQPQAFSGHLAPPSSPLFPTSLASYAHTCTPLPARREPRGIEKRRALGRPPGPWPPFFFFISLSLPLSCNNGALCALCAGVPRAARRRGRPAQRRRPGDRVLRRSHAQCRAAHPAAAAGPHALGALWVEHDARAAAPAREGAARRARVSRAARRQHRRSVAGGERAAEEGGGRAKGEQRERHSHVCSDVCC